MRQAAEHPAEFLMAWYGSCCNGEWEHSFGVRIETLDNPGWALDVDLTETPFEDRLLPRSLEERSEDDWIAVEASGGRFRARGGVQNLVDLMLAFRHFITEANGR